MKTHTLRQILAQVPASYPLVVMQAETAIEVADVSFSHQPPQVLVRLVPVKLVEPEATIAEINAAGLTATIPVMEPATVGPIESTPYAPDESRHFAAITEKLNAQPVPEDGRSMTTPDGTYIPPTPTIGEQVISAAKAKRSRKAKPTATPAA